jgi:phosphoribosyl 1,2-cyclic phosphate phosphodiesterase
VQIVVLGSGTSHGVPMIGCRCPVCTSTDPRNRRMRTSAAVRLGDATILIDTPPDLRLQALAAGLDRVDAVFYSHGHADHVMGFDELRRFSELARRPTPVYASPATLSVLHRIFSYALTEDLHGFFGIPVVAWHALEGPVEIAGHRIRGVPLEHGEHVATGLRIDAPDGAALAWCPDCHGLPPASRDRLRGLDVLFLDGLRHRPHPTHFTVAESLAAIRDLAPRSAYLVHMAHDLDHATTEAALPQYAEVPGGIRLAADGMVLDVTRP